MCQDYMADRKDTQMQLNQTEWSAEDLVTHLNTLENARFGYHVTDSFRTKIGMLSARAKALSEEIDKLNPEGDNV